jgi:SAM-dependent methyltransferase
LDISGHALERSKKRLGNRAAKVKWLEQDIIKFDPDKLFDVWHDRAVFHFLTTTEQISKYLSNARQSLRQAGYAIMATFSENGPEKCSGLPIRQYSEQSLVAELSNGFEKLKCIREDHITPFQTRQNFLFCSFKRA